MGNAARVNKGEAFDYLAHKRPHTRLESRELEQMMQQDYGLSNKYIMDTVRAAESERIPKLENTRQSRA